MSDVVVSVTESTTAVTVSEQDVAVAVTDTVVEVSVSTAGIQGAQGATGATGVVAATAPISYNSGTQTVAINQAGLTLAQSQITNLVSDLAGKANLASANAFTVGGHTITSEAVGVIPLLLKGSSGQTANLQEWQTSDSVVHSGINAAGFFFVGGSSSAGGQLGITAETPTNRGMVIKGAASQSANLQEWQNSAGTILSSTGSSGGFIAQFLQVTSSGLVQLAATNSGGVVRITKQTAAYANPGANNAGIYFRDGTDAGTLKLVVRAGATGAETTILDNIPQ